MSCIHYKFKSSLDYNSVTFDGLHLSLGDLKKAISLQKRLKTGEFELEIVNAQTGDVYKKADELIAKNTSVIVSRVPIVKSNANSTQRSWEAFKQECAKVKEKERQLALEKQKQAQESVAVATNEMDRIKAVIDQSTKGFEPSSFAGKHPSAVPPDYYTCKRCGKKGHYITSCPNIKQEDRVMEPRVKRTTGIPSTMLTIVDDPLHPGALLTNLGQFAVPKIDVAAYNEVKKDSSPFTQSENKGQEPENKIIPKELLCHICEDLCVDAAIAPCCGTSFCDECLREELLESEDHQCPSCHECNVSPDRIVANRSMRIAVTNFLNDSGYTKVKRRRSNSTSGDSGSKVSNPLSPLLSTPAPSSSSSAPPVSSAAPSLDAQSSHIPVTTSHGGAPHYPRSTAADVNHHNSHPMQITSISHDKPWRPRYDSRYDSRPHGPKNHSWSSQSGMHPAFTSTSSPATVVNHAAALANQAIQAAQAAQAALGQTQLQHGLPPLGPPPFHGIPGYLGPGSLPPLGPPGAHQMGDGPGKDFKGHQMLSPPKKKPVDVFDSFADFTKKRSRTPDKLKKSHSKSRSGSPPRISSRSSYSPAKKSSHGRSPRRSYSRSRSVSRTRSYRRSRSGARTPLLSPAGSRRSLKRSRSKSVNNRRSRSVASRGLSELRSLSPASPTKRSRSHSISPYASSSRVRNSRSPRPSRPRSRSTSKSFKRSYRSRSRSWSRPKKVRSRSYTPLSLRRSPRRSLDRSPRRSPVQSQRRSPMRSPRRSAKRSPAYSPLGSKRSFSPRRRSHSFSPKRRTPLRSKSRSPFRKRWYSRSRTPPRRGSLSPYKSRRSPSPYGNYKQRSPSPYQPRGPSGFKDRGRDRDRYPRDDRGMLRQNFSPPRNPGVGNLPPSSQHPHPPPPHPNNAPNLPPVPFLPNLDLPPPEKFFQSNPAGYQEFLRTFYAQFGERPPWPGQLPNQPSGPFGNSYPTAQPQPPHSGFIQDRRPSWESGPSPPQPGQAPTTKFGDRYRKDMGRPGFDRFRDRDQKGYEQRCEDRNRRGEHRDNDQRHDDVNRRGEHREKRNDERNKRPEKDRRQLSSEVRDKRGVKDTEKRRESDKSRVSEKSRDAGKKERISAEKKRSPERKRSPQHNSKYIEKSKNVEERKKDEKKKDEKENIEHKTKTEKLSEPKKGEGDIKAKSENLDVNNVSGPSTNVEPQVGIPQTQKENVPEDQQGKKASQEIVEKEKEKKVPGKKKVGTAGTKKLKAKDGNAPVGEKKEKKLKKKKLTFGASEADNKGQKKKKVKRVVDYKSENNCTSEDPDHEKNSLSEGSPVKKAKIESNNGDEAVKLESLTDGSAPVENLNPKNVPELIDGPVPIEKNDVLPEEDQTDVLTELPELSKWERDDFDIPEVEEPEEKPKEKPMLPRSVVDKAEKFLVEKPMKNSVIAAPMSTVEHSSDLSDVHKESPEKPKDVQEKLRNISEKQNRDVPIKSKDKHMSERQDDRHRGSLENQRMSHDERRDEMEKHRDVYDRHKDYGKDHRSKSPVHSRDYRVGHRAKSPPYNKDYRSKSPSNRDYRSKSPYKDYRPKSPVYNKDYQSKSPMYKDNQSKSPGYTKDNRSKSPSSRPRKVFMESKKEHNRKGYDIQITVKGDRNKKGSQGGGETKYQSQHYQGREGDISDEDQRSVVKSHSLERELKTSKSRKEKDAPQKKHGSEKDSSSKAKQKSKDKPAEASQSKKINLSNSNEESAAPHKSPRDLRHKIDEKTKSQKCQSIDRPQRKMSVMDESEFVPDYEEITTSTAEEKEKPSTPDQTTEGKGIKRKSSEEDKSNEDEEVVKPKKAKKKHKHKEKKDKKEKKEKHKHKKKKNKHKNKDKDETE